MAAGPALTDDDLAAFAGRYVTVDLRRSSLVAAPADAPGLPAEMLGQVVEVTPGGIAARDLACDDWQLSAGGDATSFDAEPMLADLHLHGPGGQAAAGELYDLSCEGQRVSTLYRTGPRVVVAVLGNDTLYLVLERPLTAPQVTRLRDHLAGTKFLSATDLPPAAEGLDDTTLAALREWYRYRQPAGDLPVPRRPAITAALLAGTAVLDD